MNLTIVAATAGIGGLTSETHEHIEAPPIQNRIRAEPLAGIVDRPSRYRGLHLRAVEESLDLGGSRLILTTSPKRVTPAISAGRAPYTTHAAAYCYFALCVGRL